MPPKVREIIAELQAHGWRQVTQRGSHRQYEHPSKKGRVTISGGLGQPMPPGTLSSVRQQSGLSALGRGKKS